MEQLYFLCDSNYIENFVAILDVIINVKTTLFQCRTANVQEILSKHVRTHQSSRILAHQIGISVVFTHVRHFYLTLPYQP